jgi:hypothetical protein
MKLTYVAAYLFAIIMTTLFVGVFLLGLFYMLFGVISFITWSNVLLVNIELLFLVRLCLSVGFIIGLGFALSKEGKEFVDELIQNGINL